MKRKTYMRIQLGGKFLLIIMLVAVLLLGAGVGVLYAVHHSQTTQDLQAVESEGFVHLTTVSNNCKMNVAVRGASSAKHTLVTIAGMGFPDYGVYMDYITRTLQQENRLVIIDRLGTGYSDDTKEDRTASIIVEEYRAALQKNMIDAPYVLLAHEIGAAYATLWQNTYPNEIEGIIYIDPNPMQNTYLGLQLPDDVNKLYWGAKIGLQHFIYNEIYTFESDRLPSNYTSAATNFNSHSVYTAGHQSEIQNAMKNMSAAFGSIKTTDIPKMYINCSFAFETKQEALEYVDYINSKVRVAGQEKVYASTESAAEELLVATQTMKETINNYVQQLGNCHLVKMPGGPSVYEQHVGVLEAAVIDFIAYLDGETDSLQERYVDKILQEWADHQKEYQEIQEEVIEPLVDTENES